MATVEANGGVHVARTSDATLMPNGSVTSMSSQSDGANIRIRIKRPEEANQETLEVMTFSAEETIWSAKEKILRSIGKEGLAEALNFGLYLPEFNGRAAKFLDEERQFKEYSLPGPIANLELRYKKREYRSGMSTLNQSKLKKINNPQNQKHLLECVEKGDVDGITKLVSKGLDGNFNNCRKDGETPLTVAAKLDRPRQVMMALVSGGCFLDFRNKAGLTALHVAAMGGNRDALRTLLDLGASPNYKDLNGLTALYYCVLYGSGSNAQCAQMLLHDHSQMEIRDREGYTEIHQACKRGLVQHLEHLMFYGADINAQSSSGDTPLHICARNNREECARALMFRGANKSIKNRAGEDACQVANASGHRELADIIERFQSSEVVFYHDLPKYNEKRRGTISWATIHNLQRSRSNPQLQMLFNTPDNNPSAASLSVATGQQYFAGGIMVGPGAAGAAATVSGHSSSVRSRASILDGLGRREVKSYVLIREAKGFGFVLRGTKANGGTVALNFKPSPEVPALQYFEDVTPGGAADRAGLKTGDYLLEINGENVVSATHDYCVQLMRTTGDRLELKVSTLAGTSAPPRVNSGTFEVQPSPAVSLKSLKSQTGSTANGLEELEKLDSFLNVNTVQNGYHNTLTGTQHEDQNSSVLATSAIAYSSATEQNDTALYATIGSKSKHPLKLESNNSDLTAVNKPDSPIVIYPPDYPDYDETDTTDSSGQKSVSDDGYKYYVGSQQNSAAAVNGTLTSSIPVAAVPPPPHSTYNSISSSSAAAPPPPPPPAPPLPTSFADIPIPFQSSGVPRQSVTNGGEGSSQGSLPRQVQKQLDETRKRDETHAAIIAAVQRRRNLLNSVDGEQLANSIETRVSRTNKLQKLYKAGPSGTSAQRNSTTAPGVGLLAPTDGFDKPDGASKSDDAETRVVDGYTAEAERKRLEYLAKNEVTAAATVSVNTKPANVEVNSSTSTPRPAVQVLSPTVKTAPPPPAPTVSIQSPPPPVIMSATKKSPPVEPPVRSSGGKFVMNSAAGPVSTGTRVSSANASSSVRVSVNGPASVSTQEEAAIPYLPPPAEFASQSPPAASPVSAVLRSVSKPAQSNSIVFRAAGRPSSTATPVSPASASSAGRTMVWPPKPYNERNIDTWSADEVGEWLDSIDLGDYKAAFARSQITGKELAGMKESDFERFGVALQLQRLKLEREVRKASKVN